jgi:hypothetical protein
MASGTDISLHIASPRKTDDSLISDLAVATAAGQIKTERRENRPRGEVQSTLRFMKNWGPKRVCRKTRILSGV